MVILQSTYNLCKHIKSLPIRKQVVESLHTLHYSNTTKGIQDGSRDSLGYYARKQNMQFLGYLLIDEHKNDSARLVGSIKIAPLSHQEIVLFEKAHTFIAETDNICATALSTILPNAIDVIKPYIQYPYKTKAESIETIDPNVESVEDLHLAFRNHPSIGIISKCVDKVPRIQMISKEHLMDGMIGIRRYIGSQGFSKAASDFQNSELATIKDSPEYFITKTLKALVALKVSLSVLNQLLYQSFKTDKLVVLDNDNVIAVKNISRNFLGKHVSILSHPIKMEQMASNAGDEILVKLKLDKYIIEGLHHIESVTISFNRDFGNRQDFELLKIDENLNYYPGLVRDA